MHKDVYEFLFKSGIDCEYIEGKDEIKIFMQIEENRYELCMKFPQYYPYEFPEIYIEDRKGLYIPHVYTNNKLCLYDTNEVLPNPDMYLEEAKESIQRAKNLLIGSKKYDNILDYEMEAVSYWEPNGIKRIDYLANGRLNSRILWSCEWLEDFYVTADNRDKIIEFLKNSYNINTIDLKFRKSLFINIKEVNPLYADTIKDIKNLIPKSDLSRFYNVLVSNQGEAIIIFCINDGMETFLLALKISLFSYGMKISSKNVKGMLSLNEDKKFQKLKVRNFDTKRLFIRGGDGTANFEKKCLLIGCGSIGSYVSKAIIDIGITDNITLLDNDIFDVENLARHLCGSEHLFLPRVKSEALKSELLRHYPSMKCQSLNENILKYILDDCSMINEFDIIFICVGNTLIEKKIIQLIKEKAIYKECIILWVEPFLIAGHALVLQKEIDESTEKNIFDVNGVFNNNVLINSKQYLKSETGCQSSYAPYAGFEAQKFVLDFLDIYYRKIYLKKEKYNYEFTWIGKMKWARQKNFNIKSKWRAKEDRFIELKRIDSQ